MTRPVPIGTRITDKAADLYARNAAQAMAEPYLPVMSWMGHRATVRASFGAGALFELRRLSAALRVDLTGAMDAVPAAAKRFFDSYRRSYRDPPNLCTRDGWRRLIEQSFRSGAGFVHAYLWPEPPKPRKRRKGR